MCLNPHIKTIDSLLHKAWCEIDGCHSFLLPLKRVVQLARASILRVNQKQSQSWLNSQNKISIYERVGRWSVAHDPRKMIWLFVLFFFGGGGANWDLIFSPNQFRIQEQYNTHILGLLGEQLFSFKFDKIIFCGFYSKNPAIIRKAGSQTFYKLSEGGKAFIATRL